MLRNMFIGLLALGALVISISCKNPLSADSLSEQIKGSWLAVPNTNTIYGDPNERLYLFNGQKCERLDWIGGSTTDKIANYTLNGKFITIEWPGAPFTFEAEILNDTLNQYSQSSTTIARQFYRCNYSKNMLPPGWPPIP